MVAPLEQAIEFLKEFGFFEIVLPFLLVFTIVFAVLEKTKIFGVEKIDDVEYPRRNINAMLAFVIAFLFVASKELVEVVNVSLPIVIMVLIVLMCFMMLFGFILKEGQFSFEERGVWKGILSVTGFIGVLLIFLYALKWWPFSENALPSDWLTGPVFITVIFIGAVVATILFVTLPGGRPSKPKEEKGSK